MGNYCNSEDANQTAQKTIVRAVRPFNSLTKLEVVKTKPFAKISIEDGFDFLSKNLETQSTS
jgi:hypothetical protein